jgi:uncharacterized paraquat-inducible protein A
MNPIQPISCPNCRVNLPWSLFNTQTSGSCPTCRAEIFGVVFPTLVRGVAPGKPGERIVSDEEASCFYHPQKKAVSPCDHCGRFLCSLCDVDFGGRHLCPSCLETGQEQQKIKNLENRRVLYDDMALAIAVLPVFIPLLLYFSFLTAPVSLFLAIRHWNTPSSVIPRTRFRLAAAIVISVLEIAGWAVLLYFLISTFS